MPVIGLAKGKVSCLPIDSDADTECADDGDAEPPDDTHLDEWGAFIEEALKRWADKTDDPDTGLKVVEAWNEPNLRGFWGVPAEQAFPDPEHFAELVNVAYDKVNLLETNGTVEDLKFLPGGTAPVRDSMINGEPDPEGAGEFWSNALPYIAASKVDGISVHLYAPSGVDAIVRDNCRGIPSSKNCTGAGEYVQGRYSEARSGINGVGGYLGKPIWLTELGFPTNPSAAGKNAKAKTQVRRLMDAYLRFGRKTPAVQAFVVHNLVDNPDLDQNENGVSKFFGVLGEDHTPKLGTNGAYCTLARAVLNPNPTCPTP